MPLRASEREIGFLLTCVIKTLWFTGALLKLDRNFFCICPTEERMEQKTRAEEGLCSCPDVADGMNGGFTLIYCAINPDVRGGLFTLISGREKWLSPGK